MFSTETINKNVDAINEPRDPNLKTAFLALPSPSISPATRLSLPFWTSKALPNTLPNTRLLLPTRYFSLLLLAPTV
jgi:hypothetical protein